MRFTFSGLQKDSGRSENEMVASIVLLVLCPRACVPVVHIHVYRLLKPNAINSGDFLVRVKGSHESWK